ncbi:MAG: class I SAM-dependent methyltransferase [Actinobacteria bacterium]|nr:class I SAM-dependent methyltransferase [Actinomycetota bacterium]
MSIDARMHGVILALKNHTHEALRDARVVADLIRQAGLYHDDRMPYGSDNAHMHPRPNKGLWQVPEQLAGCLTWLSTQNVATFLEIGPCSGWTTTFIAAYLGRFGLQRLDTIEYEGYAHLLDQDMVTLWHLESLPVHVHYTLGNPPLREYDAVFIDGLHTYEGVSWDYNAYGPRGRIVLFHDINDRWCHGVVKFWRDVILPSGKPTLQWTQAPEPRLMGIGAVLHSA